MKRIVTVLAAILLFYPAVRPLFGTGYFPMHDDTQIARVVEMGRALKAGQFPVRWVPDLGYGYGYPIFNFYGPLPYYAGGILAALGVDPVVATKAMFGIGVMGAGFSMLLLGTYLFGTLGGLVAAVFFMYAPYHAVQIYIRGAVGEYWATAFVPLVLYGILASFDPKLRKRSVLFGSMGLAGVILSHTISGYVVMGALAGGLALYWIIRGIRREMDWALFKTHMAIVILGLDLSAFFWLPAFAEMKFANIAKIMDSTADFRSHFLCPGQLWNSPWGFAGSAPGCVDGMSFKLGKIHVLAAALGAALFVAARPAEGRVRRGMLLAALVGVLSVIGTLSVSRFVWETVPMSSYIQYPWRLLGYAVLGLSLLAGYTVLFRGRAWAFAVTVLLCSSALVMNAKLFVPQYMYALEGKTASSRGELTFTRSKISDEYMPPGLPVPKTASGVPQGILVPQPGVSVSGVRDSVTRITFRVSSDSRRSITVNRAYFPGWTYRINGQPASPRIDRGLPSVVVSEGTSVVELRLTDTPVRLFANALSGITFLLLVFLFAYDKKTVRKHRHSGL